MFVMVFLFHDIFYWNNNEIYGIKWVEISFFLHLIMASDTQCARDNHTQMHVHLTSVNNGLWLGFKIFCDNEN